MTKVFPITILCLALAACTKTEIIGYGTSVAGVSVAPNEAELAIGDHRVLIATVLPEDATNTNIKWDSDKPEVVRVDDKGELLALAAGEAVVTATTEDGAKTASCRVEVRADVTFHVSISGFPGLSGSINVPYNKLFDNVRAEISGVDWETIATVGTQVTDNSVTLILPEDIPADRLCKVARDSRNDYTGFWPATGVSDRSALVAGLRDIIAYRDDERVGRLYPTDWDGTAETSVGSYSVYFHYSDRPFALSGIDLGGESFVYNASFSSGWNIYANINRGASPSDCTTTFPENLPLRWRFEPWP